MESSNFTLQFKINITTFCDFRGELLAKIYKYKRRSLAEMAVYQELCDKEIEVTLIENKVAALAGSIGEVLEHYHSEL